MIESDDPASAANYIDPEIIQHYRSIHFNHHSRTNPMENCNVPGCVKMTNEMKRKGYTDRKDNDGDLQGQEPSV